MNKKPRSEKGEILDFATKQKKMQKIHVEEVSPTISPQPKEAKANNTN